MDSEQLLERLYLEVNDKIIQSTCAQFNPKENPFCDTCRFYSAKIHREQFNRWCPVWLKVFGEDLHRQLEKYAQDGIKIGEKFMQIWHARRIGVPEHNESRARSDSETRRRRDKDARLAISTVDM